MKSTTFHHRSILSVSLLLVFAVPSGRADRFSWEDGTSGNFTDPKRWHGPDWPTQTRFPGAGDDASIDRGSLTVTITDDQATRELVTGQPTLNITGSYTVAQLSAYGSLLTVTGNGQLNVTLWLMGTQGIVDGAKAKITTLQPLGSELVVRNGAEVTSQTLDKSRGGLKVTVEGGGATWKHAAELPFVEIVIKANGRVEVPSTDGVFVNAEGGGAQLTASGRFKGYGRIANGARIESSDGTQSQSGGNTTIDGGTWAVQNTFINDGSDMTIQNGGVLSANDVRPGEFSSLTIVDGVGSRMSVANLLSPGGGIQLKSGGLLTCATAQLDQGGVSAETGGAFTVSGDIFCNSGLSFFNGGLLTANDVLLADIAGRGGALNVIGSGSVAQLGGLAVGQRGQGSFTVRDKGQVTSRSGGMGVFAGSDGQATVSGALSKWTINPAPGGGALLVGGGGLGTLTVDSGGNVIVTGPGEVTVGREAGSDGTIRVLGFGSAVNVRPNSMVIGQQGKGTLAVESGGQLQADKLVIGLSTLDNRVTATGQDSTLGVLTELVIGQGGRGTLRAADGAFVGAGATLFVGKNGKLEVIGARVTVGAVDIPPPGTVRVGAGGRLKGSGRVQGKIEVVNGGFVSPGSSPGTLTIEGDFVQQAGGRLEIEIGGTSPDSAHDVLQVTGAATLGGTLTIAFINGFAPKAGQSFAFLKADGGVNGSFANVEITGVAAGFTYTLVPDGAGGLSLVAQNNGVATSPPLLEIARLGGSIALSWPATGSWVLETTDRLSGTWQPVATAPVVENDRYTVTLPATSASGFFRLRL